MPGHGFKGSDAIGCPDDTGSQLSYDGVRLYVSQWYNKRILGIDERGAVVRTIDSLAGSAAQCYSEGVFYILNTDDEDSNDFFLTRIGVNGSGPHFEDLARVPFAARALASDGTASGQPPRA